MKLDQIEQKVFDGLSDMKVIDAHEHLIPEKTRLEKKIDFFILFSHYTEADLMSAGMKPADYARLRDDQSMPLEEKWRIFRNFYPMIKHGSYARPAAIWLKEVLGYDELNDKNYKEISEKLQADNKPGIYRRILGEMCHIESALVCTGLPGEHELDMLKPVWWMLHYLEEACIEEFLKKQDNRQATTLNDYLDHIVKDAEKAIEIGIWGVKTWCYSLDNPDIKNAEEIFVALRDKKGRGLTMEERATLIFAIYDRLFQLVRQHNLTVAVHSGVWGDFRTSQPTHLIPLATKYPDISFDMFHLGFPYLREAVMIGKMFPNVSLNLCWTSIISQEATVRMLDECLDMVPMNKLIAFGGDYGQSIEKVYGHLKMAKENVARALAKRIKQGRLDFDEAARIARLWFYDNPARIYKLSS